MQREAWDAWRDGLEHRLYPLQNHAQQLTSTTTPRGVASMVRAAPAAIIPPPI